MIYVALMRFADLRDGKHIYEAGAIYPRPGYEPTESRIAELAGNENRMGYPLIKAKEPGHKTDAAGRAELPVEASEAEDKETISENPEGAGRGRRSRQRG